MDEPPPFQETREFLELHRGDRRRCAEFVLDRYRDRRVVVTVGTDRHVGEASQVRRS